MGRVRTGTFACVVAHEGGEPWRRQPIQDRGGRHGSGSSGPLVPNPGPTGGYHGGYHDQYNQGDSGAISAYLESKHPGRSQEEVTIMARSHIGWRRWWIVDDDDPHLRAGPYLTLGSAYTAAASMWGHGWWHRHPNRRAEKEQ